MLGPRFRGGLGLLRRKLEKPREEEEEAVVEEDRRRRTRKKEAERGGLGCLLATGGSAHSPRAVLSG